MIFLVLTGGRLGEVNPEGVMFYNKLIDNLLLKGMAFSPFSKSLDVSQATLLLPLKFRIHAHNTFHAFNMYLMSSL